MTGLHAVPTNIIIIVVVVTECSTRHWHI